MTQLSESKNICAVKRLYQNIRRCIQNKPSTDHTAGKTSLALKLPRDLTKCVNNSTTFRIVLPSNTIQKWNTITRRKHERTVIIQNGGRSRSNTQTTQGEQTSIFKSWLAGPLWMVSLNPTVDSLHGKVFKSFIFLGKKLLPNVFLLI